MKKIVFKLLFAISLMFVFASCTQNQRAKNFGGNAVIEIPSEYKYAGAFDFDTNDDLWLDVVDNSGKHYIMEFSSYGVFQGKFEIKED